MDDATASAGKAAKLKQMLITDDIRQLIGDTLHMDLLSDDPEYDKVLLPARSHGRPAHMAKLVELLNSSTLPDCAGKKTTVDTCTRWIEELKAVGIKRNEDLINNIQAAGRGGEVEHRYIQVWADLMAEYHRKKEHVEKTTRYNFIPPHLQGKVQFIKCNSAFLPDPRSVGAGQGKADQSEAVNVVQKRKKSLQEAEDSDVEGDGGSPSGSTSSSGKSREHLHPRINLRKDEQARHEIQQALVSLIAVKQQKASAEIRKEAADERKELQRSLEKYTEYLINPNIPAEIKANYQIMVVNLQAQLTQLRQQPPAPDPSAFVTPPRPPPAPAARLRDADSDVTEDDVVEHGLLGARV